MTGASTVVASPRNKTVGGIAIIDEQNPWPGLGAFDESAERFFNGRRDETAELRRLVLHAPLTVLYAASGLGKTSLLQAGLFPLMRKEHFLPIYIRLDVRDRSAPLIEQAKQAMLTQFQAHGVDAPQIGGEESLWRYLHRSLLELWSEHNQLLTPLFVFDQFEEVFTLGAENPEGISRLRIDLANLIENRIPATLVEFPEQHEGLSLDSQRYKMLLSFREDFVPAMGGWKREIASILGNRLWLLPMSGERAFEAVHTTASHLVDQATARKIVRFVAASQNEEISDEAKFPTELSELAVEPALLSLVCHGLNEKRKAQGKAVFDEALLAGTGQSIISEYYQEAVADLPGRVQSFIQLELITGRGFRKQYDVDDARTVYKVTDEELRLLVDRRLLRIDPQRGRDRVELTHDLLTRVVREHRDQEFKRENARRQRKQAMIAGFAGAFLLLVAIALGLLSFGMWRAKKLADANAQQAYANAQRADANAKLARSETKQLVISKAELESTTRAATAATTIAETQRQVAEYQAHLALSDQLALGGIETQKVIFALWAAFVTYSVDKTLSLDVEGALRRVVLALPVPLRRPGHSLAVTGMAISPDGSRIATTGSSNSIGDGIRIWNASTGDEERPLSIGLRCNERSIMFTADGKNLACLVSEYNRGNVAVIWNTSSSQPLFSFAGDRTDPVTHFAISPDGRFLAATMQDGDVRLVNTSLPLNSPSGQRSVGDGGAAFSPNGNLATIVGSSVTIQSPEGGALMTFDAGQGRVAGAAYILPYVAFSANGARLAAGLGRSAEVWDTASGNRLLEVQFQGQNGKFLALSPDGKFLVGADANSVKIWDVTSGTNPINEVPYPPENAGSDIFQLLFSPDSVELGIGLATKSKDVICLLKNLTDKEFSCEDGIALAFTHGVDGDAIAIAAGKSVRVEKTSTQDVVLRLGFPETMTAAAFTPDGTRVATASDDSTLRFWDATTGRQLWVEPVKNPVTSLVFSSNGNLLADVGKSGKPELRSALSGKPAGPLLTNAGEPSKPLNALAFSPEGLLAAGGEDGTVYFWRTSDSEIPRLPANLSIGGDIQSLAYGESGKVVIVHSSSPVRCQVAADSTTDVRSNLSVRTLGSEKTEEVRGYDDQAIALKSSRDGQPLAVLGRKGVEVFDRKNQWRVIDGATAGCYGSDLLKSGFALSPDGEVLAVSGSDRSVILWSAKTEKEDQRLFNLPPITSASNTVKQLLPADLIFSSDGTEPVLRSIDYSWNLYDYPLKNEALLREAMLLLRSGAKPEDCKAYLHVSSCPPWAQAIEDIEIGNSAALKFDFAAAVANFTKAQQLLPALHALGFNLQRHIDNLTATSPIELRFGWLFSQGRLKDAREAYLEAQTPNPSPYTANYFCWRGALEGLAAEVKSVCEDAVAMLPADWDIRDSRGLARALTGDVSGAIEDFQFFIDHANSLQGNVKKLRQGWVEALKNGQNPFTPGVMEALRKQ